MYFLYINILRYSYQIFYFFLFLLDFPSAGIIFLKFLELHSTVSEKNIFITNFPFLTDLLRPPTPLQPKSTKHDKSFLSMLPKYQAGYDKIQ